jgi:Spy/CpxP family protein refolding chaperone
VNYWKVILATVVIFGAGVLTGGLLVHYVDHLSLENSHGSPFYSVNHLAANHTQPRPQDFPMPRFPREMAKQFVQQLNDTLKLTPEQRGKIEQIIADGQERNREIWTNVAPKMRAVIQEVNQQIRAELTPEQLKPFEELLKHPSRRLPPGTNTPPILSAPANLPLTNNAPGV